jgi:chemotaxis methyl-accepting protein methylase
MAKVGSEVGPIIEFHRVNLNDEISPLGGPFDLIWYRNVLTYFNYQSKMDIVADRALDLQSPARHRSKTRTQ